jgi:hypothetical protein
VWAWREFVNDSTPPAAVVFTPIDYGTFSEGPGGEVYPPVTIEWTHPSPAAVRDYHYVLLQEDPDGTFSIPFDDRTTTDSSLRLSASEFPLGRSFELTVRARNEDLLEGEPARIYMQNSYEIPSRVRLDSTLVEGVEIFGTSVTLRWEALPSHEGVSEYKVLYFRQAGSEVSQIGLNDGTASPLPFGNNWGTGEFRSYAVSVGTVASVVLPAQIDSRGDSYYGVFVWAVNSSGLSPDNLWSFTNRR